jgi:hypothetical protein
VGDLLADDGARADDAEPGDGLARAEAVRQHQVQRAQRARPPQPRAAVHGNGTLGGAHGVEEGDDHPLGRRDHILELEAHAADAALLEFIVVVFALVEPYDGAHAHVLEGVEVK